jgi:hypothetical protein
MNLFDRVQRAWGRYWFTPGSLQDLALVRIVVFGSQTLLFLWFPVARIRSATAQIAQATSITAHYQPLPILKLLLLPFGAWGTVRPSAAIIAATFVIAVAAGLCATAGLFSRVTMLAAALANLVLVTHWYSYGDYHHAEALMLIALLVLALSPAGRAWSLDRWLHQRGGASPPSDADTFATWPLRLMQWIIALTYLSAALSKLVYGGFEWFNGTTMLYHFLRVGVGDQRALALYLAGLPPWLHIVPSAIAFLFELTFIVAVLIPRTAWAYVLVGLMFHLAVYESMGIGFFQTMVLYIVFIESIRRYWPVALSRASRNRARNSGVGIRHAS